MTLPNLPAQASDKLTISTNPKQVNVYQEGTIALTGFGAITGGYVASATLTITQGDKGTANIPMIDMVHVIDYGSGVYNYRKGPYTYFSNYSTGAVERHLQFRISNQLVSGNTYETVILVTYFTDSISSGTRDSAYYTNYVQYKLFTASYDNTA